MTLYVADASALLRYVDREPGFDRVAELIKQAARGKVELFISAVNWGEIISVIYKANGLSVARSTASRLRALPLRILAANDEQAETAGILKHDLNLPLADAFAASLALLKGATLVTADFDFKAAAKTITIEFLPTK